LEDTSRRSPTFAATGFVDSLLTRLHSAGGAQKANAS
jgi:hypothetical protein